MLLLRHDGYLHVDIICSMGAVWVQYGCNMGAEYLEIHQRHTRLHVSGVAQNRQSHVDLIQVGLQERNHLNQNRIEQSIIEQNRIE